MLTPLVVKRFIQRPLGQGNRDRKDAQGRRRVGQPQEGKGWPPQEAVLVECRPLEHVREQLLKQQTMLRTSLQALPQPPLVSKRARKQRRHTLRWLDQQGQALEAERLGLLAQRYATERTRLCSLPGIGGKTAGWWLLLAGGFARLDNDRQLLARAGLSPREHRSGTSLRGRARIPNRGGALLGGKRLLCRFAAKKKNRAGQAR